MKHKQVKFGRGFKVLLGNGHAQVAQMVIEPGGSEGDSQNRHRGADQWLFVVAGRGVAKVGERRVPLRPGTLLLIEHGDRHEVLNNAAGLLKTLNLYVPPAYTRSGQELPAGRRR